MTHDLDALEKIAERLERGETGKVLDRALAPLVGWFRVEPRYAHNKRGAWIAPEEFIGASSEGRPTLDSLHGTTMHRDVPDWSRSLDACEALRKRLLPGWQWGASSNPPDDIFAGGCVQAFVVKDLWTHEGYAHAEATTEPAARLCATLRAFAAQERAKQEGKTDDR